VSAAIDNRPNPRVAVKPVSKRISGGLISRVHYSPATPVAWR